MTERLEGNCRPDRSRLLCVAPTDSRFAVSGTNDYACSPWSPSSWPSSGSLRRIGLQRRESNAHPVFRPLILPYSLLWRACNVKATYCASLCFAGNTTRHLDRVSARLILIDHPCSICILIGACSLGSRRRIARLLFDADASRRVLRFDVTMHVLYSSRRLLQYLLDFSVQLASNVQRDGICIGS